MTTSIIRGSTIISGAGATITVIVENEPADIEFTWGCEASAVNLYKIDGVQVEIFSLLSHILGGPAPNPDWNCEPFTQIVEPGEYRFGFGVGTPQSRCHAELDNNCGTNGH